MVRRPISSLSSAALAVVLIVVSGARGAPAERDGAARRARPRETPAEFRSGAVPNETAQTEVYVDRAQDHFAHSEWVEGLAVLDRLLLEVTSPEYRLRRQREAERRQRALEAFLRDREKELADGSRAPSEPPGRGGARPKGPNAADPEKVGDDALAPTIEVLSRDGVRYLETAHAVREWLLELPREAQELYRRTYDAPARRALEEALRLPFSEAAPALRRVAERYPLTAPGSRAWEELAARLHDAGRFGEAASALETRLELPFGDGGSNRAEVLAQAALVSVFAVAPGGARKLLETLRSRHSEDVVRIRGQGVLGSSVSDAPLYREGLRRAIERTTLPSPWPAPMGSYAHGALSIDLTPPLGTIARWITRLDALPSDATPMPERAGSASTGYPSLGLVTFEDRVFVRRGGELVCLSATDGAHLWSADPGAPETAPTTSRAGGVVALRGVRYSGSYALGPNALTLYSPPRASSLVALGPIVLFVDHPSAVGFERSGRPVTTPNHVVACDARTGKLLWRAGGANRSAAGPLRGLAFTAPPTPVGNVLIAPAIREGGFYLVALRPGGEPTWVRRYYSFSTSFYQRYPGAGVQQGTLAAAENTVVAAPGHGLVVAVEAATGRVRWMARYRNRNASSGLALAAALAHPLYIRDPDADIVVAAPPDTDVMAAFDARTGTSLWDRRLAFTSGPPHVAGVVRSERDGGEALVALFDGSVKAISSRTGNMVWESERVGFPEGRGFTTAKRVYVPAKPARIAVLDASSGKLLQKIAVLDPRLASEGAFSIFPYAGSRHAGEAHLLLATSSLVSSIRRQERSWSLVEKAAGVAAPADDGAHLFQRIRLLRSEGSSREALDLLFELISKYPRGELHKKLVGQVRETLEAAVGEQDDAQAIRDVLSRRDALDWKRAEVLRWKLRLAQLVAGASPIEAARLYVDLLREYGRTVRSPEGAEVDAGVYASDALRELRFPPRGDEAGEKRAREIRDAIGEAMAREEERASDRLEDASGPEALGKILVRFGHTEKAAEAGARLVAHHASRGDFPAAASVLEHLRASYPLLRASEEVTRHLRSLRDRFPAPDPPPLRGLLAREGDAPQPWRQGFWLSPDDGFLVESAPGSEPLPVVLAIRGGRLVAHDTGGQQLLERELPGYPDLEDTKVRLQSDVEEPGVVFHGGDRTVVYTAAGCYGIAGVPRAGGDPISAGKWKIAWHQELPHPLSKFATQRSQLGWGGWFSLPGDRNTFGQVVFSDSGDPLVIESDGRVTLVDARTGKLLWRHDDTSYAVLGRVETRGGWVSMTSTSPPGVLRAKIGGRSTFHPTGSKTRDAWLVEGVAVVSRGQKTEVHSLASRRTLWELGGTTSVAWATPSAVWTTSYGKLEFRSVHSGRVRDAIDLPGSSRVVFVLADRKIDGPATTLITAGRFTGSIRSSSYGMSGAAVGTGLWIVRVAEDPQTGVLKKLSELKVAEGDVTYDGRRHVLEDGRWLFAYNERESGAERWYTRVVCAEAPGAGRHDGVERWIDVEISGKGLGLPPRLCPVAGGLAVGNTDGFGWYTRNAREELQETGEEEGGRNAPTRERPPGNEAASDGE